MKKADAEKMSYVIKYDVIPSNIIQNTLVPEERRMKKLEDLHQFFTKLEKSILKEGIRNPIVILAYAEDNIIPRYGGSRLMVAQKYDMDIECIICDFDNVFPNSKILNNEEEIRACFKDQPRKVIYDIYGLNISGCRLTHLEED